MHIKVTESIFIDKFMEIRPTNFNYSGLSALWDYFENADDFELDVIEICCDFSQYTVKDALKAYGLESIEELEHNTIVLPCDDETIIIADF
jgi:hypothetical protein